MHTELEVSPTGRLIDHRSQLLTSAHEQSQSLRFTGYAKSDEDRRMLLSSLQLQDALLRKTLAQELPPGQSPTPPDMDFSSLEQRIANPCAAAPYYPYGR